MGKLKDMFSSQIREYGRYEKKKKWEQTTPKFINHNITPLDIETIGLSNFKVIVTDILDTEDKRHIFTKVSNVDRGGLILSIKCPFCSNDIVLNKHWNAYMCSNGHSKKIFEIVNIEYTTSMRIKELEDGW